MIIYNDFYKWKGWGKKLNLASGSCMLKIFDNTKETSRGIISLKPILVVVSDIPGNRMSVKSCAGHIATIVTKEFAINPQRMMWIEHYPAAEYGKEITRAIPEKFVAVDFTWVEDKAIMPKWRTLKPPILNFVADLVRDTP